MSNIKDSNRLIVAENNYIDDFHICIWSNCKLVIQTFVLIHRFKVARYTKNCLIWLIAGVCNAYIHFYKRQSDVLSYLFIMPHKIQNTFQAGVYTAISPLHIRLSCAWQAVCAINFLSFCETAIFKGVELNRLTFVTKVLRAFSLSVLYNSVIKLQARVSKCLKLF